jgi:hypothetical protein
LKIFGKGGYVDYVFCWAPDNGQCALALGYGPYINILNRYENNIFVHANLKSIASPKYERR